MLKVVSLMVEFSVMNVSKMCINGYTVVKQLSNRGYYGQSRKKEDYGEGVPQGRF